MINKYPKKEVAFDELEIARTLNPGIWIEHSKNVGLACSLIAENCNGLDKEKAYVLGLLHDIGRRAGIMSTRHIIEGYKYCMSRSWEDVAKVCLTHSFMIKDVKTEIGKWDVSNEEYDFIKNYIQNVEYDDYDKLLQICDSLGSANRLCYLEERFIDVTRRYGFNEYTVSRWEAIYEIQAYFERKMGKPLYSIIKIKLENS